MANKKRQNPNYHRGEPSIWGKIAKTLGVVLVIAAIFGAVWGISKLQPRKVGFEELDNPVGATAANVAALHDRSLEFERKYNDAKKLGDITTNDIENLREALRCESEYLKQAHQSQKGSDRLVALTVELETCEAKPLSEQSIDLKNQAEQLVKDGKLEEARKLYIQAADLEERIQREFPHSKYSLDATTAYALLHRQVLYLMALPLNDESVAAEATAKDAAARKDWDTALTNYQRARDLQLKINREFPGQSFASSGRLQKLIDQVNALQALPDHQQVEKLIADAKAAEATGTPEGYAKAAELYQQAERQQRDLVVKYPQSIFATDANYLVALEDMRQTALSRPLAEEIITRANALCSDLRQRHADRAAATVGALQQKAELFHTTFPRSKLIDDELQQRLDYLALKSPDLGTVQELVYGNLLALPGQTRYQLDKQEVSQKLYQLVAGGKPSRNAGDNLPVDSVNWNEAREFCRRLSWILARPVRLPTAEEFRLALGPVDKVDVATMSWNGDNSSGKTQPAASKTANANGFYDLLGNVAEWLERPSDYDDDSAPVIGGSAQTPVDAIRSSALSSLLTTSRNAFTGFRLVVDTDDSAPLLPKSTLDAGKAPSADLKTSANSG